MTHPAFRFALAAALCLTPAAARAGFTCDDLKTDGGKVSLPAPPQDPASANAPWPADMEAGFWERVNHSVGLYDKFTGATTGEHEKWNYPTAMWCYLNGQQDAVVSFLQQGDGEQKWTDGVDLYWCFTLKGQARKYFFFNPDLSDAYKQKMRGAMEKWTAQDPRPTLELVLAIDSDIPGVKAYALELLHKMKVPSQTLLKWADEYEPKNKEFAAHARKLAALPGYDDDPGDDPAKWMAWWKLWADGDWKVFEEYERMANPNPHPEYGIGTGPVGGDWSPKTRGMRADARNTDNLRSMRETTVYLFAEEVGNQKVRALYKEKIKRFTVGLYHVGMGEWDSESYHPHTIMPWLTLYDYAKDPEVKLLAKATLDWLHTASAVKYHNGGWTGPSKRDYGGTNATLAASAASHAGLVFGQPINHKAHHDDIHAALSTYRPPLAVVHLARKDLKAPVELHNTKPEYSHWLPGASDAPQFFETMYFGKHFVMGSAVAEGGAGDVAPFKLTAAHPEGVWYFTLNSGKWYNRMEWGDQRGQYENLLIHVRKGDDKPFMVQVPKDAPQETADGVWFIDLGDTWLAVHLIGLELDEPGSVKGKSANNLKEYTFTRLNQTGQPLVGYALQVGEKGDHASFADFKQAVLDKAKLTIDGDTVTYTAPKGKTLKVTRNDENNLPIVERDGKPRDWSAEYDIYDAGDAEEGAWLGWKQGTLTVKANGHTFTSTVTAEGDVSFSE